MTAREAVLEILRDRERNPVPGRRWSVLRRGDSYFVSAFAVLEVTDKQISEAESLASDDPSISVVDYLTAMCKDT